MNENEGLRMARLAHERRREKMREYSRDLSAQVAFGAVALVLFATAYGYLAYDSVMYYLGK